MRPYSYESIMRAVGQMLDTAGARSVAVRETDEGLIVAMQYGEDLTEDTLTLDFADLAQLIDWSAARETQPHYERAAAAHEGTLAEFLRSHSSRELVGSHR